MRWRKGRSITHQSSGESISSNGRPPPILRPRCQLFVGAKSTVRTNHHLTTGALGLFPQPAYLARPCVLRLVRRFFNFPFHP
jgi:hypothetical protein